MNRELHIVGFQVGRETYGGPITSLHEIVRVPEITAVPDAPAYEEGVINLRGKLSQSSTCACASERRKSLLPAVTAFWCWSTTGGSQDSSLIPPRKS